jgi:hypothetical protein
MNKCKNVLHWLQVYALQEHAPLISIILMQKLDSSYERSSRTHPLHEIQPPCTWKSTRSHKKYINIGNKNIYIPLQILCFCGWAQLLNFILGS